MWGLGTSGKNNYGPSNMALLYQASTDEDGRLLNVHPFTCSCRQRTKIWAQTVHIIQSLDQDYHFKMDELTDLTSWTDSATDH